MIFKVKKTDGDTSWFIKDRFGMFIHFGLYSVLGRHEWIKTTEQIADDKYDSYMEYFDPDLFDAKEWARKAKEAGMKYAVLTTKHHEGFCMFDSKYTDYKITNTPFKRDLVKEYVDAFREAGLKVGLYYSIIDWHHPEFPIDMIHPRRDDGEELEKKGRNMKIYCQYMRDQVKELLTNYGTIDILWFDFEYGSFNPPYPSIEQIFSFDKQHPTPNPNPRPWMSTDGTKGKDDFEAQEMIDLVRSIAPNIIINNRLGIPQDISTPEQVMPKQGEKDKTTGEYIVWEACHTFSGSWGYYRDEMTWKSPETLIQLLVKTVACGGNMIMNVGPTGRGNFDYRADNSLNVYRDWMTLNSRSIYDCTIAEDCFVAPEGTVLTEKFDGTRVYIHIFEYPFKTLSMPSLKGKIKYAQFLHDASEVLFNETDNDVIFNLPIVINQKYDCVIEVFLK